MTADLVRLRSWALARQRLKDPAATPLEALRAVGGVYSAHPSAPLSLWIRTVGLGGGQFRAMEAARATARIPAMRVSIFLVLAGDAGTIFTATAMTPAQFQRRAISRGVPLAEYAAVKPVILAAAEAPRRPDELSEAAGPLAGQLGIVLRLLAYEGLILRVGAPGLRSDSLSYVATRAWLGHDLDADPTDDARDEALGGLAGTYLRAFGPARAVDFAWWAGVSVGRARRAVAHNDTVDIGDGLRLLTADQARFDATGIPKGSVVLLPKWDPYTMGYAPDGRARFVDPGVQPRVYPGMGDGLPVVLIDGQVAGLWTSTKAGATVEPFEPLGARTKAAVDDALARVGVFLDGAAATI